jgi:hypothetical protein
MAGCGPTAGRPAAQLVFAHLSKKSLVAAMMWIRDILMRIRIRGSVLLTYGSRFGSGSCFFRQWLTRCNKKYLFKTCFAYYFMKVHEHQSSKIKIKKEVKTSRNKVFSYFFACQ